MGRRRSIARGVRAGALAACLLVCIAAVGAALCQGPGLPLAGGQNLQVSDDADGFPIIDWDYWLAVNPAVVGWVTVPGTAIDHPIVAAGEKDAAFYLSHGIGREADRRGCPFLDADCEDGLDSPNAVVYGHNWKGGQMFSDFARFADAAFAMDHATILLQSPTFKRRLSVQCVEVAGGADATNAVRFANAEEFKSWYQARFAASCVQLGPEPVGSAMPQRICTFCTCVDDDARDERVLVHAYEG